MRRGGAAFCADGCSSPCAVPLIGEGAGGSLPAATDSPSVSPLVMTAAALHAAFCAAPGCVVCITNRTCLWGSAALTVSPRGVRMPRLQPSHARKHVQRLDVWGGSLGDVSSRGGNGHPPEVPCYRAPGGGIARSRCVPYRGTCGYRMPLHCKAVRQPMCRRELPCWSSGRLPLAAKARPPHPVMGATRARMLGAMGKARFPVTKS